MTKGMRYALILDAMILAFAFAVLIFANSFWGFSALIFFTTLNDKDKE